MTRTVLRNANLLDGVNPLQECKTLIISGNRIEAIGPGDLPAQPEDQVYDLTGMTLMPGLINTHYHATYQDIGAASPPVGMEAPPGLQTLRAANNLKKALHAGFTGVISAGAPYAIDAACKQAIADGIMQGPRIMAGSRDVSNTGHCQDTWQWHWGPGSSAQTNIVDGPDGFRKAIREEIKRGAEIIKIFLTAGHGVPGVVGKMDLGEDELKAAIDAAHARNVKVRAHIANKDAMLCAVRLGLDVVDHGDGLDQECIDEMLPRGTFFVPSMLYISRVMEFLSGDWKKHNLEELDKMFKILPVANHCGLKLTLGDDFGALPLSHGDYAQELIFYVEDAGINPLDVIRWGTVNGAEMMGMGHELGQLKAGFLADVLVVAGNPVENIRLLQADSGLKGVIKDGAFYRNGLGEQRLKHQAAVVTG